MNLCSLTRKGKGVAYEATWVTKMDTWAEQWDQAMDDVHQAVLLYDASTYATYLGWYHGATW